jgi:hypothetical protein
VPVTVSRRISAPASAIFQLLADPGRHRDLDGSGMLRGVVPGPVICGVGDVFVMKMYFGELGDYQMINHVVEYEPGQRIGWEPEAGRGHPNAELSARRAGAAVVVSVDFRWPGRHRGDGDLRLLAGPRRPARRYRPRQHLG